MRKWGFPLEPQCLPVLGEFLRQDLQRDISVELGIGGTVDLAHASLADLLQDFVVAGTLADYTFSPTQILKWKPVFSGVPHHQFQRVFLPSGIDRAC